MTTLKVFTGFVEVRSTSFVRAWHVSLSIVTPKEVHAFIGVHSNLDLGCSNAAHRITAGRDDPSELIPARHYACLATALRFNYCLQQLCWNATQVPIQFEFEIEVTKSHPHFKIGPLRGIVPANGAAEVNAANGTILKNFASMRKRRIRRPQDC